MFDRWKTIFSIFFFISKYCVFIFNIEVLKVFSIFLLFLKNIFKKLIIFPIYSQNLE